MLGPLSVAALARPNLRMFAGRPRWHYIGAAGNDAPFAFKSQCERSSLVGRVVVKMMKD